MDIATILTWFKRGCKPTEAQFAATFQSFRHKDDAIPMGDVSGLTMALANKSENGHTHTLSEITDYDGGDKEVINAMVAQDSTELETFTKTAGMYYILLSDDLLYQCVHDEDTDTDSLTEVEPDGKVVYSAYDANENLHIYLYNMPNLMFQDVTNEQVDKTIYTNNLESLITRQLANGVYSVVYINSGIDDNTYGDAYTLTVGDGSIASRVLECRTGWAQTILVDETYQWQWHNYSYNGHGHQQSDVEGLTEALAGKAASNHDHDGVYQPAGSYAAADHNHDSAYAAKNHTHSEYLTQHQDISGKQDKTDNSLLTTAKNIVSAINELWNKFADYALANHNHNGVYQPAGDYASRSHGHAIGAIEGLSDALAGKAASNHNHDGVYQPAGNYAASDHTHSQYLTQHQDISGKQDKTDNSLLTTVKTIVGAINELWNKFADYLKGIQHVTYAQLVTLRNNNGLVAGQWYRITDYMTTVANDTEARSAGHPFDLLVMATSANTLSEEAKAVKSSRDSNDYFTDANLNAWKVWYSLDNDTTRFQWADTENGKGVIWRMIDEWQNDCPYDFKNVQFKRYKVTPTTPVPEDVEEQQLLADLDGTYIGTNAEMQGLTVEDYDDFVWVYTFSFGDRLSTPVDASLMGYVNDEQGEGYGYKGYYGDNVILPCTCHQTIDDEQQSVFCLNNVVWITNNVKYRSLICGNRVESECINMTLSGHGTHIKHDCQNIIMGDGCLGNTIGVGCFLCTFGNGCSSNTFGNDCWYNTFGNGCGSNTFGNYCYHNTFGNYFQRNTFGNGCGYNTFGNGCYWNTFGNYFQWNTFGNDCRYNTFGNDCCNNTFGNDCYENTFGNGCNWNTFGNNCWNNTFGNSCGGNTFGNNCRYITVHNGVQYVEVPGGSTVSAYVQNAQILNGTHGTDSSNLLQISFQEDADYCQFAGLNSSGILKIWVPADAA